MDKKINAIEFIQLFSHLILKLCIDLAPLYLKYAEKLQEKRFDFIKSLASIIPENVVKVSKIKCSKPNQQTLFINICNALKISPDYLLRDSLTDNDVSRIRELTELWESTQPSQQEIAAAMIQAVLERKKD